MLSPACRCLVVFTTIHSPFKLSFAGLKCTTGKFSVNGTVCTEYVYVTYVLPLMLKSYT